MPQPSWPEEIQQANDDLDPWGIGLLNEDVIIAFIERWGDCTPETLQRSLDAPVERASVWMGTPG
ncbi:MAG TPA: hypothetical protein VFB12_30300 [Ktedonobacteraceae bacterium]|nr:hypothetical protein [Ktedonobacteraceae bacterium]